MALLQAISWFLAFLFLPETHPKMATASDSGLKLGRAVMELLRLSRKRTPDSQSHNHAREERLSADNRGLNGTRETDPEQPHELGNVEANGDGQSQIGLVPTKVFTSQVILQILAVSLLAFHKVAFDAFMPTFLAAPRSAEPSKKHARNIMESSGGFGYGSQKIGVILLTQAIVVLIAQVTVVSRLIDWAGPLTACRVVFGMYPVAYVLTPFLPLLVEPLPLITVGLNIWITAILSSIGYICSAILSVVRSCSLPSHLSLTSTPVSQIQRHRQSSSPESTVHLLQSLASRGPWVPWWLESSLL